MSTSDGARRGRQVGIGDLVRAVAARHAAEVVACAEDAVVVGSPAMLERLFDGLCEHAVRAGATRIRIAVQGLGDAVAVHVEAEGAGGFCEDVERLAAAGGTSPGPGGVGLPATASMVMAQGGQVRCMRLARGSRCSVTLPGAGMRTAGHG